jgi:hypothetical protein
VRPRWSAVGWDWGAVDRPASYSSVAHLTHLNTRLMLAINQTRHGTRPSPVRRRGSRLRKGNGRVHQASAGGLGMVGRVDVSPERSYGRSRTGRTTARSPGRLFRICIGGCLGFLEDKAPAVDFESAALLASGGTMEAPQ